MANRSKIVYQYGLDGHFIQSFSSIEEASISTGIIRSAISNCLKSKMRSGSFQWRDFYESSIDPYPKEEIVKKTTFKLKKKIEMLSLNGDYIRSFESTTEAEKELGISPGGINGALTGKYDFSYGHKWRYANGFKARKNKVKAKKKGKKYCELSEEQRLRSLASGAARYALKIGQIEKKPCERCGESRVQAHHEDYTKRLDVVWLCKPCHVSRHQEMKKLGISAMDNYRNQKLRNFDENGNHIPALWTPKKNKMYGKQ